MAILFVVYLVIYLIESNDILKIHFHEISNIRMPISNYYQISGYDINTNCLYIIGGRKNVIWKFYFNNYTFTSINKILPTSIYSQSQGYSYNNNDKTIYFYNDVLDTGYLYSFNIMTLKLNNTFSLMEISVSDPCISIPNNGQYLLLIGGEDIHNRNLIYKYTQIYMFNIDKWFLTNYLNMNYPRRYHACSITNNDKYIYVFAGDNGNSNINTNKINFKNTFHNPSNSIEKLYIDNIDVNINNINSNDIYYWKNINDKLLLPRLSPRAITVHNYIFIIGGFGNGQSLDISEYININNDKVYKSTSMNIKRDGVTTMFNPISNQIFIFGM